MNTQKIIDLFLAIEHSMRMVHVMLCIPYECSSLSMKTKISEGNRRNKNTENNRVLKLAVAIESQEHYKKNN